MVKVIKGNHAKTKTLEPGKKTWSSVSWNSVQQRWGGGLIQNGVNFRLQEVNQSEIWKLKDLLNS